MLRCILRVVLLFVLAAQSFGCKSYQFERGHHISVDEEGRALGRVSKTDSSDKGNFTLPLFASFRQESLTHLTNEEFQIEYVDQVLDKMERHVIKQHDKNKENNLVPEEPAQILLFIHGGLNSYEKGLEHIQELLEKQDPKLAEKFPNLGSYFILSLNWEAGLRSALTDHFFHIRYGQRSTAFATSTFPIVLLHDMGNSIIKTPDAIYSEATDLFQNQSVDFTSALLTTAVFASIYGLPIAALHPTLTIAGVMPYATYAAAGAYGSYFFWPDLTRYSFWPIRMASAPLIEGFGTPAWDMLKRRPDLLLFNPTIKEEGATRQLLTQLAGKIQNGRWQTERCVATKNTKDCPLVELTLLGHSMGAMVSDRILTTLSDKLAFKRIIYMGAANSIADFKVSVIPYLRDHPQYKTEFWSFALSEIDEINEKYHFIFDFLSRGSLLVWIDQLLERTYGLPQKRFGREVNQDWVNIDNEEAWKAICRISFSGNRLRTEEPREHGDFTKVEKVELVLGMVKDGCPGPVKLTKDHSDIRTDEEFRQDLKKELRRIPRFTLKSIAAIADNAPYSKKDDLDEGEFLSDQTYKEISNYLLPIDINTANTDELALLLRGDRYLARNIIEYTCKNKLMESGDSKGKMPHVNDVAQNLISTPGNVSMSESTDSSFCIDQGWLSPIVYGVKMWGKQVARSVRSFFDSPGVFFGDKVSMESDRRIRKASRRYYEAVMSSIANAGINSSSDANLKDSHWDAVLEIQGERIAIEIHTWAKMADWYNLEDQEVNRAEYFADKLIKRAAESDVHAVIFVANEDIFSKPSMTKAKEAIQKSLGEKFHSVNGLPKSIPDKIKSVLERHTKQRVS